MEGCFCEYNYFAVKILSGLLRGTISIHNGGHYCINCLHSFETESKLDSHKKVCKDHGFYRMAMSEKDKNILMLNQDRKSFICYLCKHRNAVMIIHKNLSQQK